MELWLIRHGTTRANLEGRLQGTLPFPLGPEGRKEVTYLAERLKAQPFSAIFSSSALRARQTTRLLYVRVQAPPPLFTPLLQEYHWGIAQGLNRQEMGERYPSILEKLERNFHKAEIPGAEGIQMLFQRAGRFYRFLETLERSGRYKLPILVVSHGRFLQAFIQCFLAYDDQQGWPFSVSPASLTVLDGDFQGRRRLKLFNDTCHLHRQVK